MNRVRRLHSLGCAAALVLIAASFGPRLAHAQSEAAAPARTLHVFAAASLSDAFNEIARVLESRQPGLIVRLNFAGSQQLAAQLDQGAGADIFASADERWMDHARDRKLLSGEPDVFARNPLVGIVPKTNPARIGNLKDFAKGGVKLVLGADAVPVGRYSRVALRNLDRDPVYGANFSGRVLKNIVSEEENVKSVVGKVQLGEADAGIVYRSDVTPAVARYVRIIEIPAAANVIASYPIAVVSAGTNPDAARAFVDLVLSPEGQGILERRGLQRASR
ncbi:MAG: molybdate ABC transporter substrate-binding protein [Candidatus Eiseniibacteriota bacterium]